jgi:beta-glucosidase
LQSNWIVKEITITEIGYAASDEISADGEVYDSDRVMYLRNGLGHLHRPTAEGLPVKGNFIWSAFDNLKQPTLPLEDQRHSH